MDATIEDPKTRRRSNVASPVSSGYQEEKPGTRRCRVSSDVSTPKGNRRSTSGKDEEERLGASLDAATSRQRTRREEESQEEEEEVETMPEPKDDRVVVQDDDDDEIVNLDLNEPSPEIMEYARRKLGESDEVKCQTLQELRDLIYERGDFLPHRMDDAFLLRFLRARNFNVQRANRLIANYYRFKEEYPEIHVGVNPIKLRHIGDDDVMTVPAYRTQCGRRMVIYRMGNWNPRKYSVEEIFKATVTVLELGVLEPRAQILGGVAIFDLQGITMAHAWTITPQVANMVIALMVTSFPMKTYAIHILHQSWVFDAMFAVFKPLLDTRMQKKIFFHGSNMESLHKHISPTHLPKKYGGTREELPYYMWVSQLGGQRKILEEMQQLGYVMPDDLKEALADFVQD